MKKWVTCIAIAIYIGGCSSEPPATDEFFQFPEWPPLHHAAFTGDIESIVALINAGADVNAIATQIESHEKGAITLKHTPLHVAAGRGNVETIKVLANIGADINAKGTIAVVSTVSTQASPKGERFTVEGETPLHVAATYDYSGKAVRALVILGADVNARNSAWFAPTPLHMAVGAGNIEATRALITAGANVNAISRYSSDLASDRTPTPLHVATEVGNIEATRALIAAGADVHAKTYQNKTPLDLAQEQKNQAIAKILENAGDYLSDLRR